MAHHGTQPPKTPGYYRYVVLKMIKQMMVLQVNHMPPEGPTAVEFWGRQCLGNGARASTKRRERWRPGVARRDFHPMPHASMANTMVKNPDFSWQKSLIFSSNRLNESTVFVRSCLYHWFLMFLIYSVCIYIYYLFELEWVAIFLAQNLVRPNCRMSNCVLIFFDMLLEVQETLAHRGVEKMTRWIVCKIVRFFRSRTLAFSWHYVYHFTGVGNCPILGILDITL